ncbi:MAG TPA: hypothetical protein VI277_05405 [Candidatus Limnocylindria bacterium]
MIAAAVAISVVGGCSAPPPTPGQSESTPPPTPGQSGSAPQSSAASPGDAGGLFTDPPDPRNLQPTLATSSTASADIGWEGGTIEASGPSGASYRLEIPPEALAVPTTITMTPLSELTGFGSLDASIEHTLGVELEPDGLELLRPAHLTMRAVEALPEAGVATGDYLGHGEDAALLLTEITDATINFEITHFSGYWSVWPLQMEEWRVIALHEQELIERRLQGYIADVISWRRFLELHGEAVQPLADFVRNMMEGFDLEEQLLQNRLALADNGCPEAQMALRAFLAWDRQLQLMGIADDEELYAEFRRPIPPELFEVTWNQCLDEEYQRCAAIGDWIRLATFLLQQNRQRAVWEVPLTDEQVADAKDRLKRCGHWTVRLTVSEDFGSPGGAGPGIAQEWESEIHVRFTADGDLPFGLSDTGIGYGETYDIEVNELDVTLDGEEATLRNFLTGLPAQARIVGLTFDSPSDGTEPKPLTLKLWIDPGTVTFDALHVSGFRAGEWIPQEATWAPSSQVILGAYPPTIADAWAFGMRPFSAEFVRDRNSGVQGLILQSRIELIVEHTPD